MATDGKFHYKGKYRGVFRTELSGVTHAASFYDVKWIAIEIRDVEKIPARDPNTEKVGDYHYAREIRPRGKWSLGGVDLVILKDDTTAFSEKIFDVVFVKQGNSRDGFNPKRTFTHVRTSENEYLVEGDIFFSLPGDPPKPVVKPVIPVPVTPGVILNDQETIIIESVPDPIVFPDAIIDRNNIDAGLQNRKGCFSPPATRSGCLNPGGCIGGIFKLIRWGFTLWLLLALIGYLMNFLSQNIIDDRQSTGDGDVKSSDLRLDPKQDTLAPQPWNYLKDHEVKWYDFIKNNYTARYTTSTYELEKSSKRHAAWKDASVTNELLFYHDIYQDLYQVDRTRLDSLVSYFSAEQKRKGLDALKTAEMVVTFIQEIPYVLVHDGTCGEATSQGGFLAEYHADGKPCLPNVIAGVLSPYEFAHTMDGDCDTRSLLAYTLLDRLGIGASIWVSREYGHSILGVAVPVNSSNYKKVSGTRYFGTELTVKGFRVGMIAPEHTDMDNWNVVLYNQ